LKITVAISNLDCEGHLRRCLRSVLAQARRPDEWILIDDGSSDGSRRIMAEEVGPEVNATMIFSPHSGVQRQRNIALGMATGDAVAFLDSDAHYFPHYLARLEEVLEADPRAGLAYCRWYWIREPDNFRFVQTSPPDFDRARLLRSNYISMCSLFRREALEAYGFDESLPHFQDWDVALGITGKGWAAKFAGEILFEAALRRNGITMRRRSGEAERIRERHRDGGAQ